MCKDFFDKLYMYTMIAQHPSKIHDEYRAYGFYSKITFVGRKLDLISAFIVVY